MKKTVLLVLGLIMMSSTAMAAVYINWNTINGMVADGQAEDAMPPPGGFLLDANSAIWQLIYAGADNTIDRIDDEINRVDPAAWAANNYLRPGGDDELIAQRDIPQGGGAAGDGTTWNNWMVNQSGDVNYLLTSDGGQNWWNSGAMVYQRIFQVGASGMTGSTWFYETPSADMLAIDILNPGPPSDPQFLSVATPSTFGVPTHQVMAIPEPATMSLLGLGALAMVLRRRRS